MQSLAAYLPPDRLQALVSHQELPTYSQGAVLFADISGFTALTEAFKEDLGLWTGAEELSVHLNYIYDGIISCVERYGGNVIFFSGDAITCWYPGSLASASRQAVSSSLAMQALMRSMLPIKGVRGEHTLAIKAAVAVGWVQRLRAGDPQIQYLDILAGEPLEEVAEAEHLARRGEVLISRDVAMALGESLSVVEWRMEKFGLVKSLSPLAEELQLPLAELNPTLTELRPWILPAVAARVEAGMGDFLTELRPMTALFLRFIGLNYHQPTTVVEKLDPYLRWVQQVLNRYEAALLQVTLGDKGSYFYATFGAPIAHDNDVERAAQAALELLQPPDEFNWLSQLQIGISQGIMRTGSYGSSTRHTYGALGDDVNLAARLMQLAKPGEILVSQSVQQSLVKHYQWENRPPESVKGKTLPVATFRLIGKKERAVPLSSSDLPEADLLIGRAAELVLAKEKLDKVLNRQGQILCLRGEAGIGKSRLATEISQLGSKLNISGFGAEFPYYGINSRYLGWRTLWRAFFDIDSTLETGELNEKLTRQIRELDPQLLPRQPLLSSVLGIDIPDNELTATLEGEVRKAALESLLVDCLKARTQREPLLLVLEDCHWLDALSYDLLLSLSQAITNLPVFVIATYRSPSEGLVELEKFTHSTTLELKTIEPTEITQVTAWLSKRLGQPKISTQLAQAILARAEGNPFYMEELVSLLRERAVDLSTPDPLASLDLPVKLHSLVLSRFDRLSESQKGVLKVSSIIGKLFSAAWIWGSYPKAGTAQSVQNNLKVLTQQDITLLHRETPELEYMFRHSITQEVAYATIPGGLRYILHEAVGYYIEEHYTGQLNSWLDQLAFHYGNSKNISKQRQYYRQAGEAAQNAYANKAAVDYYQKLLAILGGPEEELEIKLKLGAVLELVGQWQAAEQLYQEGLAQAQALGQANFKNRYLLRLANLLSEQGQYEQALPRLHNLQAVLTRTGQKSELAEAFRIEGWLYLRKAEYPAALTTLEKSRSLYEELGDRQGLTTTLQNLGRVSHEQGDYLTAEKNYFQSLAVARELQNRRSEAETLNQLGHLADAKGEFLRAKEYELESLESYQQIGYRQGIASAIDHLGNVALGQGEYEAAGQFFQQSLQIHTELGDKRSIAIALNGLGAVAETNLDLVAARSYYEKSLLLAQELDDKLGRAATLNSLGALTLVEKNYLLARSLMLQSLDLVREAGNKFGMTILLQNLGFVNLELGQLEPIYDQAAEWLVYCQELNSNYLTINGLTLVLSLIAKLPQSQSDSLAIQIAAGIPALLTLNGGELDPDLRSYYDQALNSLRDRNLPDFEAFWLEGQNLSRESALLLAHKGLKNRPIFTG